MSEKKKDKKKKSREETDDESTPQENMITFNPNTDVIVKLGQLVNIKNVIASTIDNHPECKWSSQEVLQLGLWMEEINKYIRENAIDNSN